MPFRPHEPLMPSISASAIRKLSAFSTLSLANTAWALALWGGRSVPLLEAISSESISKIQDLPAQQCGTLPDAAVPSPALLEHLRLSVCRFLREGFCPLSYDRLSACEGSV